MAMKDVIEQKLRSGINIDELEVLDESHKHAGHAGAPDGGESHFSIYIKSPDFAGKSRMECHRMVYGLLKDEMAGRVHALAIKCSC